jgi:hypothetical protein
MAAFAGELETARLLIVGEELDASTRSTCAKSPLMMAILPYPEAPDTPPADARARRLEKLDAAGLFLTRCFQIGAADQQGRTALHVAVEAREPDHRVNRLIKRMLECGVSPDPQTNEGVTPLMLAVQAKRTGVARLLLEEGADLNLPSNAGKTALQLAEESGDRTLPVTLRKIRRRDAGL